MEKPKNKNFANTASRISAIASSVMDLHVRIALQEVDREKRRLISGGIFLAIGSTLLLFCLLYTSPSPRDISGSRMPSSA